MFSNIFKVAAGLIFVIALVTAMFALGSVGRIGFERALGVDHCIYAMAPVPEGGIKEGVKYQSEICEKETRNSDKRTVADAAAMLLVSLPTAIFFYRKVRE